ncbi:C2H2-type zinc finger [Catovirus CTV1]|uniref:C2H2-type zinc finger n=1 Tax=Catovirus CTV1 TaxID=1977631 RepID=A0A1V0SBU1_9VIRU|nr:C2H2-type zinc finger [Catovirus CTV1]
MLYVCEKCEYTTSNKGNYYKHKKSIGHILKSTIVDNFEGIPQGIPQNLLNSPQLSSKNPPSNTNKIVTSIEKEKSNKKKNISIKEYKCIYCDKEYSRSDNLNRHMKYCLDKENKYKLLEDQFEKYKMNKENEVIIKEETNKLKTEVEILREKIKTMEEQKEQYKEHIETLKNENKFQKQLIESAGGIIKKSMNTMSYLLLNYNTAPQLKSLPDYSIITKNTETLINDLIFYHKKGTFEKYIGDFIIKQYKRDDPKLQSLWSSDIDRLNYFIRELNQNKSDKQVTTDLEKIKLNWTIDKKGIKVQQSIIDPLLEYINQISIKYIREKNDIIPELSASEATKLVSNMQEIGNVSCGIKDKSISENINKYIAPFFYLNK